MEPNKYIDPVKTGKFIARLRESHNWTQDELGSRIFISRKSVSKWETGKCCPSIDMVKKLSEVFGVTFDEMIAGEFLDKNGKEITGFRKILHNKAFKISAISIVILLFTFLIGFFIYNFNSTKVYDVNYEDDNFTIKNGTIILSHAKNYINLGTFYFDLPNVSKDAKSEFTLYYKDNEKTHELITFKLNGIYFNDKTINNESLTSLLKKNIDNLYIKISVIDEKSNVQSYDIKPEIRLNFKDNFVFSIKNHVMGLIFHKNYIPDLEIKDSDENSSNITIAKRKPVNVEFLYNFTPKELKKKYDGKNITVDGNKYKIKYDASKNILILECSGNIVNILLNSNRVNLLFNEPISCEIGDDFNVYFNNKCGNNYSFILKTIEELKNL